MRSAQSLPQEDKQDKVFRVFEKIAKGYDSANVRISLGMQDSWKKMLIRELARTDACGSGTDEEPAAVSNEVIPARNCKEPSSESRHKHSPHVTKASLHYLRDRSEWTLPDKDYRQEILKVCREIAEKKTEKDFAVKTENCSLCPFAYMCKRDG